jgi:hypothetical protein
VPGELRRNRKFSNFPPQSENIKVKPGAYTGDFPQRGHILAVCGAKLAGVYPDKAQIAEQGLPLDVTAAPSLFSSDFFPHQFTDDFHRRFVLGDSFCRKVDTGLGRG